LNKLDGFMYLAERYRFPLIKMKGKRPIEKDWQSYEYREFDKIGFNRGHNAGIICGNKSGLIVLDIDDLIKFESLDYEIPDTFTVQTGKKGYHHYFLLPEQGEYRNRSFGKLGFDIRANGGCVVAPFSSHPETKKKYKIICEMEISSAPDWLLELSLEPESIRSPTKSVQVERQFPIDVINDELFECYNCLLSKAVKKGHRSEYIWKVIRELVEDGLSDDEIIGLFERYHDSIGEKYFEKGGARIKWLLTQIQKARLESSENLVVPFEAENQEWVELLHSDLMNTFRNEYMRSISEGHSNVLRQVCNLLIALLNNENSGWYCIPLGVGAGKTLTIKHLIRHLYKNDKGHKYSIALSLEKISEIEDVKDWLLEHGVSNDYFQVVHHKVDDIDEVFKSLPKTPVIIHTHYKLRGNAYLTEYFKYKGQDRDLMIFDESMCNCLTFADISSSVGNKLGSFLRAYRTNQKLSETVPEVIYQYIKTIENKIEREEVEINLERKTQAVIELPVEYIDHFTLPDLLKIAGQIGTCLSNEEEATLIRDLLLLGNTPKELRQIFVQREDAGNVLFTIKEQISDRIKNLVTTDASRQIRNLFSYSQRKVKILKTESSLSYEKLSFYGIELSGGREKIQQSFKREIINPYLLMLEDILIREGIDKDFLIFHSKQLDGVNDKIILHLLKKGIIDRQDIDRIKFETFGRENATNKYNTCQVIIFFGLHYKPTYTIKSLLFGETKELDVLSPWVINDVQTGEIVMQLHQGSGRGTIRNGESQSVYFCAYNPTVFFKGLKKAYPQAQVGLLSLPQLEVLKTKSTKVNDYRAENFKKASYLFGISKEMTREQLPFFLLQELTPKKFYAAKGLI